MDKKDYEYLVKEHERLYTENPGEYFFSHDEIIEELRDIFLNYPECSKEKKLKMILCSFDGFFQTFYYQAFLKKDIELLNNAVYEVAHMLQISCVTSPGCDHGYFGMRVTPELLAANMFERIKLVLPEENGLGKYAFDGTQIANMLMAILYKNHEFNEKALEGADRVLSKKSTTLYMKSYISCMKYILTKDADSFNNELESFCNLHKKSKEFGMNSFKKNFCIEAHGLYNLALWAYDGEFANKIRIPEVNNFCQELAYYQKQNKEKKIEIYQYPDDLDICNKIMRCEPPKMHLIKISNKQYIDTDRYFKDIAYKIL